MDATDHNDSLNNDYDNVKILAMIAYTLFMLYIRHLGIGKLLVGEHNELVHVPRMATAAAQGEAISIPQMKAAIVHALKILITKPDTESQIGKEDSIQDMTF